MTQIERRLVGIGVWLGAAAWSGCTGDLANLTASLGGDTPGQRGQVQVLFINNTAYRAVFTFGTYDQTDPGSVPDARQFGNDPDELLLEGDSSSGIGSLDCDRVCSIGGSRMLALLAANGDASTLDPQALVDGVEFFEVPEDADAAPISRGFAPPFEALLGVDFPCHSLLIIHFEINDAGPDPFRVAFELISSGSPR